MKKNNSKTTVKFVIGRGNKRRVVNYSEFIAVMTAERKAFAELLFSRISAMRLALATSSYGSSVRAKKARAINSLVDTFNFTMNCINESSRLYHINSFGIEIA